VLSDRVSSYLIMMSYLGLFTLLVELHCFDGTSLLEESPDLGNKLTVDPFFAEILASVLLPSLVLHSEYFSDILSESSWLGIPPVICLRTWLGGDLLFDAPPSPLEDWFPLLEDLLPDVEILIFGGKEDVVPSGLGKVFN